MIEDNRFIGAVESAYIKSDNKKMPYYIDLIFQAVGKTFIQIVSKVTPYEIKIQTMEIFV